VKVGKVDSKLKKGMYLKKLDLGVSNFGRGGKRLPREKGASGFLMPQALSAKGGPHIFNLFSRSEEEGTA